VHGQPTGGVDQADRDPSKAGTSEGGVATYGYTWFGVYPIMVFEDESPGSIRLSHRYLEARL
jgi:hypothetical protein